MVQHDSCEIGPLRGLRDNKAGDDIADHLRCDALAKELLTLIADGLAQIPPNHRLPAAADEQRCFIRWSDGSPVVIEVVAQLLLDLWCQQALIPLFVFGLIRAEIKPREGGVKILLEV